VIPLLGISDFLKATFGEMETEKDPFLHEKSPNDLGPRAKSRVYTKLGVVFHLILIAFYSVVSFAVISARPKVPIMLSEGTPE